MCLTPCLLGFSLLQINANETADALDAVVSFDDWLNSTLAKQEESALTEAPVLRAEDVNRKIK